MRQSFLASTVVLAAFTLAGCPDDPKEPPKIVSFSASSTTLPPGGGEVRLAWVQTNATELFIDGGVGSVKGLTSKTVYVTSTTTFTLTASNKLGSDKQSVTVTVEIPTAPPTITGFTANPWQLPIRGGTARLSWSVNGATSLFIDNGVGDVTRKSQVDVNLTQTTTFTLTATNDLGSVTAQTTVTVIVPTEPPDVNFFTASPSNLPINGGSATLSWDVTGFTELSIDHGVGTVTNRSSISVNVTQTTTFTLTASNVIGSTTAQATVTVYVPASPPVIHSFTASPATVDWDGGWVRLSWSQTDAQSLVIDNGVGNVTGKTYVDVFVSDTVAFKLTAQNVRGSSQAIALVQVAARPAPWIASFYATPSVREDAGYIRLSWTAWNYDTLSIFPGVGDVTYRAGGVDVWVEYTTTFTLTARQYDGRMTQYSTTVIVQ